jgi:hypothetical protein
MKLKEILEVLKQEFEDKLNKNVEIKINPDFLNKAGYYLIYSGAKGEEVAKNEAVFTMFLVKNALDDVTVTLDEIDLLNKAVLSLIEKNIGIEFLENKINFNDTLYFYEYIVKVNQIGE